MKQGCGNLPNYIHVAWYNDVRKPAMPGKIVDAGLTCGSYNGEPFYHCHGQIRDANGKPAFPRILRK